MVIKNGLTTVLRKGTTTYLNSLSLIGQETSGETTVVLTDLGSNAGRVIQALREHIQLILLANSGRIRQVERTNPPCAWHFLNAKGLMW
jgi:hypothetical protein